MPCAKVCGERNVGLAISISITRASQIRPTLAARDITAYSVLKSGVSVMALNNWTAARVSWELLVGWMSAGCGCSGSGSQLNCCSYGCDEGESKVLHGKLD